MELFLRYLITGLVFGFIGGYIGARLVASNVLSHLKTIMIHKWWVFIYCCKCGLIWRGIKHDLSKFSPTEFMESIQYYTGTRSPIDACKEVNGYSKAWQHHKGRNTHHYEHWTDNYDSGATCILMPPDDAIEMICDYLAAARAYMGKDFSYKAEYSWWKDKKEPTVNAMHPIIKLFVRNVLYKLKDVEIDKYYEWKFNKKNLISEYEYAISAIDITSKQ